MKGYLLAWTDGQQYGFRLEDLDHVFDLDAVYRAPGVLPAVRGVTAVGDRLIPLVDLAALIAHDRPPAALRGTGVLTHCPAGPIVFEVDDVDTVVGEDHLPLPAGWHLPWALGIARSERLVPIIDVANLAERLAPPSAVAVP